MYSSSYVNLIKRKFKDLSHLVSSYTPNFNFPHSSIDKKRKRDLLFWKKVDAAGSIVSQRFRRLIKS